MVHKPDSNRNSPVTPDPSPLRSVVVGLGGDGEDETHEIKEGDFQKPSLLSPSQSSDFRIPGLTKVITSDYNFIGRITTIGVWLGVWRQTGT